MKTSKEFLLTAFITIIFLGGVAFPFLNNQKQVQEVKGSSSFNWAAVDTYVSSANVNQNYDGQNSIKFGYNGSDNNWIYMQLPTPTLPAGSTINTATLSMYLTSCSGVTPDTFTIAKITSPWQPNTVTWATKPTAGSPITGYFACTGQTNTTITFNLKSYMDAWNSGQHNYGIVIYGPTSGNYVRYFGSRESAHTSTFNVTYTYPDAPTPPANPDPAPANPGGTTSTTPSVSTISNTPIAPKVASEAEAPVDASVAAPVLNSVAINENERQITKDETLEVNQSDTITIKGTAVPNAGVVIFIGENAFETTATPEGSWALTLDARVVSAGEYSVEAQSQVGEKGSEKVKLFNLKINEQKTSPMAAKKTNYTFVIVTLVVFLLLAGVAVYLVYKTQNKKKDLNKKSLKQEKNVPK